MSTPSVSNAADVAKANRPAMSPFERFLSLWVAACIVAGIGVGHLLPGLFRAIGGFEVALLIWLMIIPMLLKIDLLLAGLYIVVPVVIAESLRRHPLETGGGQRRGPRVRRYDDRGREKIYEH